MQKANQDLENIVKKSLLLLGPGQAAYSIHKCRVSKQDPTILEASFYGSPPPINDWLFALRRLTPAFNLVKILDRQEMAPPETLLYIFSENPKDLTDPELQPGPDPKGPTPNRQDHPFAYPLPPSPKKSDNIRVSANPDPRSSWTPIPNYLTNFWGGIIGSAALHVYQLLLSFQNLPSHMQTIQPSIGFLTAATTIHRQTLVGRSNKNQKGILNILAENHLLSFTYSETTGYHFEIPFQVPLLRPSQVAQLPQILQTSHYNLINSTPKRLDLYRAFAASYGESLPEPPPRKGRPANEEKQGTSGQDLLDL